jgi:hypothetical protein
MEPEGILPCSEEHSTGHCPEPDESSPSYLCKVHHNIILPSMSSSTELRLLTSRILFIILLFIKGKVVPVINWLNTTPWKGTGEWLYRAIFSWPRLHAPAALGTRCVGGWVDLRTGLDDWKSENSWSYRAFFYMCTRKFRRLDSVSFIRWKSYSVESNR